MKNVPKGKCDGMGDLDKMMDKMTEEGGMIKNVKIPAMSNSMPMKGGSSISKIGGGGGMKGGGGSGGHGGHG